MIFFFYFYKFCKCNISICPQLEKETELKALPRFLTPDECPGSPGTPGGPGGPGTLMAVNQKGLNHTSAGL